MFNAKHCRSGEVKSTLAVLLICLSPGLHGRLEWKR